MRVANYRKFLGYTQEEFSKFFDISTTAYARKERGETPFSDKEKTIIKNLLLDSFPNITIDEIFFDKKVTKVAIDV